MKKGVILIEVLAAPFLLMALWPAPVLPQGSTPENGTTWKEIPRLGRVFYVKGYGDGQLRTQQLTSYALSSPADKSGNSSYFRDNGFTPSPAEIESAVNEFYSVPENLPVCIASAVDFEWLSLAGHPYEKRHLEAVRKVDGREGCYPLPWPGQYVKQEIADLEAAAGAHPKEH